MAALSKIKEGRPTKLKILQWNASTLNSPKYAPVNRNKTQKNHLRDLKEYLDEHSPDIALISETHHKVHPENAQICTVNLPGYQTPHIPACNILKTRGMITAIKNTMPYTVYQNDYNSPHEIIDVLIQTNETKLRIIHLYKHHGYELDIDMFNITENIPTLLAGDLNAWHKAWGCKRNDQAGQKLHKQILENNLYIANNGEHTRNPGSAIDLAITNQNLAPKTTWSVITELRSDHYATLIHLNYTFTHQPYISTHKWKFDKKKVPTYQQHCDRLLELVDFSEMDLQTQAETISSVMTQACELTFKPISMKKPKKIMAPYALETKYRTAKNALNRLEKSIAKIKPTGQTAVLYQDMKNELIEIVEATRSQAINEHTAKWVDTINHHTTTSDIWQFLNKLTGKPATQTQTEPDPQAKANALMKEFIDRSSSQHLSADVTNALNSLQTQRLEDIETAKNIPHIHDSEFTITELESALQFLKPKSSPGEDGLSNNIIINSSINLKIALLDLYNKSWSNRVLPHDWLEATLVAIPKPHKPNAVRPISLLICISKLMERMVKPRLKHSLGPRKKYCFGFTEKVSTTDSLAHLTAVVTKYKSPVLFLDLEKAFELANKTVILDLLQKRGVTGNMLAWIEQYLSNRRGKVKFQNKYSKTHTFQNGTPQGSVLSPILFNTIVDELISTELNHPSVITQSYADDIQIMFKQTKHIKTALHNIYSTCCALGLQIEWTKSLILPFSKGPAVKNLKMKNIPIPCSNQVTNLGVKISKNLSFTGHVNYIKEKTCKKLNALRYMTAIGISSRILLRFYQAAIRSVIEYGSPCFHFISDTQIQKLQVIQNSALRSICRAPRRTRIPMLHMETNTPTIKARFKTLLLNYVYKLFQHENHPLTQMILKALPKEQLSYEGKWLESTCTIIKANLQIHPDDTSYTFTLTQNGYLLPMPKPSLNPIPTTAIKANVVTEMPKLPKAQCNPLDLFSDFQLQIMNLTRHNTLQIYTDGSVDPNTHRAGAGFIITQNRKLLTSSHSRISDHACTLQTELVAIQQALKKVTNFTTSPQQPIIIHTDSLSSLQVLQHANPSDNQELITETQSLINKIHTDGHPITLHWIPSHVNIQGNEAADQLAKQALKQNLVEIKIPISYSFIKNHINCKIAKEKFLDPAKADPLTKEKVQTYQELTLNKCIPQNLPAAVDRALRYLRMQYSTPSIEDNTQQATCPKCDHDVAFTPTHYLLECPANDAESTTLLLKTPHDPKDSPTKLKDAILKHCITNQNYTPLIEFVTKCPMPQLYSKKFYRRFKGKHTPQVMQNRVQTILTKLQNLQNPP